jgi:hypothetical protein
MTGSQTQAKPTTDASQLGNPPLLITTTTASALRVVMTERGSVNVLLLLRPVTGRALRQGTAEVEVVMTATVEGEFSLCLLLVCSSLGQSGLVQGRQLIPGETTGVPSRLMLATTCTSVVSPRPCRRPCFTTCSASTARSVEKDIAEAKSS